MTIEFEVWPAGSVERVSRVVTLLRRREVDEATIRAAALEVLALYEGELSDDDREALVGTLFDPVSEQPVPAGEVAVDAQAELILSPPMRSAIYRARPLVIDGLLELGYRRTRPDADVFTHPAASGRRVVVHSRMLRFEVESARPPRAWELDRTFWLWSSVDELLALAREWAVD